jgi:hypothetical protein
MVRRGRAGTPGEGKEAGGPQIRFLRPHREWRASREGPGAAAGAFSFPGSRASREEELRGPGKHGFRGRSVQLPFARPLRPLRGVYGSGIASG